MTGVHKTEVRETTYHNIYIDTTLVAVTCGKPQRDDVIKALANMMDEFAKLRVLIDSDELRRILHIMNDTLDVDDVRNSPNSEFS